MSELSYRVVKATVQAVIDVAEGKRPPSKCPSCGRALDSSTSEGAA